MVKKKKKVCLKSLLHVIENLLSQKCARFLPSWPSPFTASIKRGGRGAMHTRCSLRLSQMASLSDGHTFLNGDLNKERKQASEYSGKNRARK